MKIRFLVLLMLSFMCVKAQNRLYRYAIGGKWGITNEKLEKLTKVEFDTVMTTMSASTGFAIVQKNNQYGVVNRQGKLTVPFQENKIVNLGGYIGTATENGKRNVIDFESGKQLTPYVFDDFKNYCFCKERILIVQQGSKSGFLSGITGKLIGDSLFDDVRFLNGFETRGWMEVGDLEGVLDLRNGKIIIPLDKQAIKGERRDQKRVIQIMKQGETIFLDSNGKAPVPAAEKQEVAGNAKEGEKSSGEPITHREDPPRRADNIRIVDNGGGNWSVIFPVFNEERVRMDTTKLKGFSYVEKMRSEYYTGRKQLIKAVKDGKTGLIDKDGTVMAPFIYDKIEDKSDHLLTSKNGKVGVINNQLVTIKMPVLKSVIDFDVFKNAFWIEMPSGERGYMDNKTGKIYIPGIKQ